MDYHAFAGRFHELHLLRELASAIRLKQIPPATTFLIALCCGIHLAKIALEWDIFKWSFVPDRVVFRFEVWRIFTSALVHYDNFHLLSNMLGIITFQAHLERRFGTLRLLEYCLYAIVLSKGIYVIIALGRHWIIQHGNSSLWHTSVVGFSDVIYSMAILDCCLFPHIVRVVDVPLLGPKRVPAKWYPWVLMLAGCFWLPRSSFVGHLSGILAGVLIATGLLDGCFASNETLQALEQSYMFWFLAKKRLFVETTNTRRKPMDKDALRRIYSVIKQLLLTLFGFVWSVFVGLVRLLSFGILGSREIILWKGEGRQLANENNDDQGEGATETKPSMPSSSVEKTKVSGSLGVVADSTSSDDELMVNREPSKATDANNASPSRIDQETDGNEDDDDDDDDDSDSDTSSSELPITLPDRVSTGRSSSGSFVNDSSGTAVEPPQSFSQALETLTTVKSNRVLVINAVKTITKMTVNATTKGRSDAKYRKIRLEHPSIQQCKKVAGALVLIQALGFEIKENFDDDKFLVYPRPGKIPPPEWIPAAVALMETEMERLHFIRPKSGEEKDDYRLRAAKAAAERMEAAENKKTASKKRQQAYGYSAGLAGRDTRSVHYHNETWN